MVAAGWGDRGPWLWLALGQCGCGWLAGYGLAGDGLAMGWLWLAVGWLLWAACLWLRGLWGAGAVCLCVRLEVHGSWKFVAFLAR
jgi:hypothetical protein